MNRYIAWGTRCQSELIDFTICHYTSNDGIDAKLSPEAPDSLVVITAIQISDQTPQSSKKFASGDDFLSIRSMRDNT